MPQRPRKLTLSKPLMQPGGRSPLTLMALLCWADFPWVDMAHFGRFLRIQNCMMLWPFFAGHPNLASEWLGEPHPNFLDPKNLKIFDGVPVFIYHGLADEALDVKLMQELSEKLVAAGAKVTTSFVPDRGHVYQDDQTHAKYVSWLAELKKGKENN